MINNLEIAIKRLMEHQLQLRNKKDNGSEELVSVFDMQSEILRRFGLPKSSENMELLVFDTLLSDVEITKRVREISDKANKYLLSDVKTDLQLLLDAKESNLEAWKILPELKVSNHRYTHFLYYEKFINQNIDGVEILKALKSVKQNNALQILSELLVLPEASQQNYRIALDRMGVMYYDEFLDHYQKDRSLEIGNLSFERFLEFNPESFDDLESGFFEFASFLMNNLVLVVSEQPYRIIECEVYYHNSDLHPDPYVHKRVNQKENGRWYFNDAGLDITFGNPDKNIFASFLIRGVQRLDASKQLISGPINVLREVFTQFGHITNCNNGIAVYEVEQGVEYQKPVAVGRVGLAHKAEDKERFDIKPYRFLIELHAGHKFSGKEKVVKQLITDGKISVEDAKEIMGYKVNLG